jgi:CheY-like chemotaxis protein
MQHEAPLRLPSLAGRHILLVEPDPRVLVVHVALMRQLGARVTMAAGTLLALGEAGRGPFDAVVVPARAPECPGHALVESLRRRAPGRPALFCGGAPPGWESGGPAPTLGLPECPALADLCDALHRLLDAAVDAAVGALAVPAGADR